MPDGRLRNATAYSTNKSTQANRRRVSSMAPEQLQSHRKKTSEYQAIWQLLHRVARKDDYRRANRSTQRTMLQNSCNALMEKRRREGKAMCDTDTETMIERHLKKESTARAYTRSSTSSIQLPLPNLKGVAIDPFPHDTTSPLSPPTTPSDLDADGDGDFDYDNDNDPDFDILKSETDPNAAEIEHFDTALDAQLKDRSRSQSTHTTISTLRSELRSLRAEVTSLHNKIEALQQVSAAAAVAGEHNNQYSCSTTTTTDGGSTEDYHHHHHHQMYQFQPMGVQPVWAATPQGWDDLQQGHGQDDWVVLGPQPY